MNIFALLMTFYVGFIIAKTKCDDSCDRNIQKLHDILKTAGKLTYTVQKYGIKPDETFVRLIKYLIRAKNLDAVSGVRPDEVENLFSTGRPRDRVTIYKIDFVATVPDLFTGNSSPWYMLTSKEAKEITPGEASFVQSDQPALASEKDRVKYELHLGSEFSRPANIQVQLYRNQNSKLNGYIVTKPTFAYQFENDEQRIRYSLMFYEDTDDGKKTNLLSKAEKEKKLKALMILREVGEYLKKPFPVRDPFTPLRLDYRNKTKESLIFLDDDKISHFLKDFVMCTRSDKVVVDLYSAVKNLAFRPRSMGAFQRGEIVPYGFRSLVKRSGRHSARRDRKRKNFSRGKNKKSSRGKSKKFFRGKNKKFSCGSRYRLDSKDLGEKSFEGSVQYFLTAIGKMLDLISKQPDECIDTPEGILPIEEPNMPPPVREPPNNQPNPCYETPEGKPPTEEPNKPPPVKEPPNKQPDPCNETPEGKPPTEKPNKPPPVKEPPNKQPNPCNETPEGKPPTEEPNKPPNKQPNPCNETPDGMPPSEPHKPPSPPECPSKNPSPSCQSGGGALNIINFNYGNGYAPGGVSAYEAVPEAIALPPLVEEKGEGLADLEEQHISGSEYELDAIPLDFPREEYLYD